MKCNKCGQRGARWIKACSVHHVRCPNCLMELYYECSEELVEIQLEAVGKERDEIKKSIAGHEKEISENQQRIAEYEREIERCNAVLNSGPVKAMANTLKMMAAMKDADGERVFPHLETTPEGMRALLSVMEADPAFFSRSGISLASACIVAYQRMVRTNHPRLH